MNAAEIRTLCIESADTYLKFMEDNNRGFDEVNVLAKDAAPNFANAFKLRLAKKLFDTESIQFRDLKNKKDYNAEQIKIVEYDIDSNLLYVRPSEDLMPTFRDLNNNDVKVISDLKFLIKNVKLWYETNGAFISLPTKCSVLKDQFNSIQYLKDKTPSQTQKFSLSNTFTQSYSYVWGAPGTGKTQYVLAYSALQYIRNGMKIAIFAPTNNALEQILRGVIRITDEAGVKRNQIIRLGNPTRKFAEEFPEVCEERGVQKNVNEIEKQINLLKRISEYGENLRRFSELEIELKNIKDLSALRLLLINENKKLSDERSLLTNNTIDLNALIEKKKRVAIEKSKIEKKSNSLIGRTLRKISAIDEKQRYKIDALEADLVSIEKSKASFEEVKKEIEVRVGKLELSINAIENKGEEYLKKVRFIVSKIPKLSSAKSILTLDNWDTFENDLKTYLEEEKGKINLDKDIAEEYEEQSPEAISIRLLQLEKEKEKILGTSTEARLEFVNIVACTLDTYIGRFRDKRLKMDHIFLDEAGYANLIKALTLFCYDVPITFLGDHMQLPPVCEINDFDIENNEEYKNMYLWAQSALYVESLFSKTSDVMRRQFVENQVPDFVNMSKTELTATFRFGSNLASILDQHVYNIGLVSSNGFGETVIEAINAYKTEGRMSRESENEAIAIKNYIAKYGNALGEYVLLCPYRKQVTLLGRKMPAERNALKILTVHGSQGREWDTVFLSVVDTGDKWFVDSRNQKSRGLNLLNTAVSRAKKRLVIVCDQSYWNGQPDQLIYELVNN